MPKVTIELSDEAAAWVKDLVDNGEVPSASAYIDFLLRRESEALEKALQEGLDSGVSERTVADIWQEVLAERAKAKAAADA